MDDRTLGRRIAEVRRARNLTQNDLADVLDIGVPQVSRLEDGSRKVSAGELARIAERLSVPMEALLFPSAYGESFRTTNGNPEQSSEVRWFREFRIRYTMFVNDVDA